MDVFIINSLKVWHIEEEIRKQQSAVIPVTASDLSNLKSNIILP